MKDKIIKPEEISDYFSFIFEGYKKNDYYFCNCGHTFLEEDLSSDKESDNDNNDKELFDILKNGETKGLYDEMIKNAKLSLGKDVICPDCEKNFSLPVNRNFLMPIGKNFLYGFEFVETDENIILYLAKANSGISKNKKNNKDIKLDITESVRYISFNKNNSKIEFQDFGDSNIETVDLHEVIDCVNSFFKIDEFVNITNIFKLHLFVNRLANFVSDTKNSNIAEEFLIELRGVNFDTGLPFLKKLFSIFLGITQFTNLSTIALTKSSSFLYDLMLECEIPSAEKMKESGATSPVKIFNFLVTKYLNELNEEVNEDNKDVHSFKFKSSSRVSFENSNKVESELSYDISKEENNADYSFKSNKKYKSGKVVKVEGSGYKVLDTITDGTVSKFIYKNIDTFSQYKQLVKYLKFYNKSQLINLMGKYDLKYLSVVIDSIYFRKKMDIDELERVLDIILSFLKDRFHVVDYSNIEKSFSFVEYDDAKLMMEILEFDPRRDFNKISDYAKLVDYHDNLVKFYKVTSDEKKNGKIGIFVSKFRYLEDDYDGRKLRIVLHDKPELIIREGIEMRHSAAAYASNVAQETYLLASIFDEDPDRLEEDFDRYTIGFTYNKTNGLEFDQVKSYGNKLGSNRFKTLVMEFLEEKDVSYRPIKDLKTTMV